MKFVPYIIATLLLGSFGLYLIDFTFQGNPLARARFKFQLWHTIVMQRSERNARERAAERMVQEQEKEARAQQYREWAKERRESYAF